VDANTKKRYKQTARKWAKRNRRHIRKYARLYYQTHKKQIGLRARFTTAKYTRTLKGLFSHAVCTARAVKRDWTLTREEYEKLRTKKCYYCSGDLPIAGVGLDRLDNTQGYHLSNVVPCCTNCNKLRGDRLTPEETRIAVGAIMAFRVSRNHASHGVPINTGTV